MAAVCMLNRKLDLHTENYTLEGNLTRASSRPEFSILAIKPSMNPSPKTLNSKPKVPKAATLNPIPGTIRPHFHWGAVLDVRASLV